MPAFKDRMLAAEALQRLTNELSRPSLTAPEATVLRHRLLTLIDTIHRSSRSESDHKSDLAARR
jgi:hypothetical protein